MAIDFSKMVGPLPIGAWAAIVGGGVGFALYSKHRSAAAPVSTATVPVSTTAPDSGVGGSGQWQDLTVPTTPTGGQVGALTSNDQWEISAVNYLIGHGYDPGLADSAIRKYVGGEKLSVSEYALVREVLLRVGEPPQPLTAPYYDNPVIPIGHPGPTPTPGPPHTHPAPPKSVPHPIAPRPHPKPKPKPAPRPALRRYTVKHGDTLWGIAMHYYHNPLEYQRIYNANRTVIGNNPRMIRPGEVLTIP